MLKPEMYNKYVFEMTRKVKSGNFMVDSYFEDKDKHSTVIAKDLTSAYMILFNVYSLTPEDVELKSTSQIELFNHINDLNIKHEISNGESEVFIEETREIE